MNVKEFEEYLANALLTIDDDYVDELPKSVKTFENTSLLTMGSGVVVTMQDGSKFALAIQQVK